MGTSESQSANEDALRRAAAEQAAMELDEQSGAAVEPESSEASSDELAAANERILRLQAEMQNLRNRTAREIAEERRYAAMPILRDLLPVIDNIDRAIEAAEKAGEAESLLSGTRLVRQQLETVLSQHHCQPINPVGEPFDPHFHEAILHQPTSEVPPNHVAMVTQIGYQLHDRVVRPAQVIVSRGAPDG